MSGERRTQPPRVASARGALLPMSREDLRFYLAAVARYADISLRDGNDPEQVLLNVWTQIASLGTAVIDGVDSDVLADRELSRLRQLARELLDGLTRLIDAADADDAAATGALQTLREMAEELVSPYAEKLPTGRWSISLECEHLPDETRRRETDSEDRPEAPPRGGAATSKRQVAVPECPGETSDRYADARTLLETTDGAEFGLTAEPVSVAQRLRGLEGPLVRLELAGGEGGVWISPRVVRLLRAGPQLEETNHHREGNDEVSPR